MTNSPTRSIPFAKPWITDADRQAVMEVMQGTILTHGPQCKAFEQAFVQFMGGGGYAVTTSSCMAALHLVYFEMGLGEGDEVIVPAQTHTATAHGVELVGARPVFVDCELHTGNIDVTQIEAKITPATKAISLVHFVGIPARMDAIMDIAKRHNLKVVEDCALAIGSTYKGIHVGFVGDVGCFSFYPAKHITTGEGGMYVTKHESMAISAARKRAFGVDRSHTERKIPGQYDVVELGLNYRMSELQAAIGRVQLTYLPEILSRRKANFTRLQEHILDAYPDLIILDSDSPDAVNSYYCLTVILDAQNAARRLEIISRLNAQGIGTSIYYPAPVPAMTYYREKYGYTEGDFPHASRISYDSIALPVGPHLDIDDVDYIGRCLREALKG